jgi:hypothetical protein
MFAGIGPIPGLGKSELATEVRVMTEALELEPGLSDGDLVRSAADGDRHAFAEIYDRYADRLYDFCVGLVGDRDAATDCVQDTFCVAATDLLCCRNRPRRSAGTRKTPPMAVLDRPP